MSQSAEHGKCIPKFLENPLINSCLSMCEELSSFVILCRLVCELDHISCFKIHCCPDKKAYIEGKLFPNVDVDVIFARSSLGGEVTVQCLQ